MKKFLRLLTFLVMLVPFVAKAQILEPVQWTVETEKLNKNEYNIVFKAEIEDGWHLYSQNTPFGGPMPLYFEFIDTLGIERIGGVAEPKAIVHYSDIFEIDEHFFEKEAVFTQRVKLLDDAATVTGVIIGQTCKERCIQLEYEFEVQLGEPVAVIKEAEEEKKGFWGAIIPANATGEKTSSSTTALCEEPKYSDIFRLPHGLKGYYDYEQGLACAKAQNKPIYIDFTGHGSVYSREMEANVWSDPRVLEMLRNEYVIIALYVDDRTKLPESEWGIGVDGKEKKIIGSKNADFQISKFKTNVQPYYCLMGHNGELLVEPRAYSCDKNAFVEFLKKGIENFNNGVSIRNINE